MNRDRSEIATNFQGGSRAALFYWHTADISEIQKNTSEMHCRYRWRNIQGLNRHRCNFTLTSHPHRFTFATGFSSLCVVRIFHAKAQRTQRCTAIDFFNRKSAIVNRKFSPCWNSSSWIGNSRTGSSGQGGAVRASAAAVWYMNRSFCRRGCLRFYTIFSKNSWRMNRQKERNTENYYSDRSLAM